MLLALLVAAQLSDDVDKEIRETAMIRLMLPRRTAGLLVIPALIVAVICGFAAQYRGICVIRNLDTTAWSDALYASFLTVGFSDLGPNGNWHWVVMGEFANGILLLTGAFSLLISRLYWETPRNTSEETPPSSSAVAIDDWVLF